MEDRKPRRLDAEGLLNYALRVLGGRACSTGEMREKLARRAEHAEDIPQVLARLKDSGYLDDKRFAAAYSASRLENQGFGRMRVLSDLRKRRVAPALAGKAVEEAYRESDECELIEKYLRRKYRTTPLETWLTVERNLAAAYRRLRTAGFSSGNSIRVLKRFAAAAEELEGMEDGSGLEP